MKATNCGSDLRRQNGEETKGRQKGTVLLSRFCSRERQCPYRDQAGQKNRPLLSPEEKLREYPRLMPIYGHRYIPCLPHEAGNPIFSVYQTDIIFYGFGLANYFQNEFQIELPYGFEIPPKPKCTDFWSVLLLC
jgi:hypothetical protein